MRADHDSNAHHKGFSSLILGLILLGGCLSTDDDAHTPANVSDAGQSDQTQQLDDSSNEQDPGGEWGQWGTFGSTVSEPRSARGFAYCGLDDIRLDDVSRVYDREIPELPWGSSPIEHEFGRCGDDHETIVWRLMNCERMTQDAPPLKCDLRLVYLGRLHSRDMIDRSYFDHENPDGESPFDRMSKHDIGFRSAGENLAMHWEVEGAHFGWMDSDGHRGNILNTSYSFSHAGIGVIISGRYYYLTQLFIRP